MSNTNLTSAYGTIIDSHKDTFQREWVANKLESANFSIKRAKETLDTKQAEWLTEYENCEHTGQATEKLGSLERTVHSTYLKTWRISKRIDKRLRKQWHH